MLEKITGTFSGIIRTLSGKSSITEKNIEETVEQIKMALLEADVNLRVVRRFVNSTIEEAKGEKVLKAVDPGQQFVKIIYDKAELTSERDIADEDLWGIVTKKESARQNFEMSRFGNKQVNRYLEKSKMATEAEFTSSLEENSDSNAQSSTQDSSATVQ